MSLITRHDIIIERYAPGAYVDGYYIHGGKSVIETTGNVQPVTGNELLQLPEGDREKDVQKIYSTTELKNDDIITVTATGIKYVVQKVSDYSLNDPAHYKALMIRKQYE